MTCLQTYHVFCSRSRALIAACELLLIIGDHVIEPLHLHDNTMPAVGHIVVQVRGYVHVFCTVKLIKSLIQTVQSTRISYFTV